MLVLSEKTPMGLVLLLSSTNLRSMRLVVLIFDHSCGILILKKAMSSSSDSLREASAFGYRSPHVCAKRFSADLAFWIPPAWLMALRSFLTASWSAFRT